MTINTNTNIWPTIMHAISHKRNAASVQ